VRKAIAAAYAASAMCAASPSTSALPASAVPRRAETGSRLAASGTDEEFEAATAKLEPVTDAVHVTGRFDYQLRVACRDTAELDRLLRHLKREGGVSETDTRVVLRSAFTRGAP
jgi:Lrp/AsnC family leucine-responsive transcriptional regulator